MKRKDEIFKSLKIHNELTDKKLLGTITKEEEKELERIRIEIESLSDESNLTNFLEYKIAKYQQMLDEIEEIKKLLKSNGLE